MNGGLVPNAAIGGALSNYLNSHGLLIPSGSHEIDGMAPVSHSDATR